MGTHSSPEGINRKDRAWRCKMGRPAAPPSSRRVAERKRWQALQICQPSSTARSGDDRIALEIAIEVADFLSEYCLP